MSIQSINANTTVYHGNIYNPCAINDGTGQISFNIETVCPHNYSWYISYRWNFDDCGYCSDHCGVGSGGSWVKVKQWWYYTAGGGLATDYLYTDCSKNGSWSASGHGYRSWLGYNNASGYDIYFYRTWNGYHYYYCEGWGDATVIISTACPYTVKGNVSCVNSVKLYINNSEDWIICNSKECNSSSPDNFSFTIYDGSQYKLVFNDGHEYEFTCNGSDVEYDYNVCTCIYGYTCNINWVKLWRDDAGSWTCIKTESQPYHGVNIYLMQIESGYNYKLNFSDGHEYEFTCDGSDIKYDWDRCIWAFPPSPWQPPEIIPWYLGYDNNIVFMRDSHGNFIENAQIAVYNKNTGNYTQKWTNTPDPYILLAANNDSNDDVIVMCRTFDGIFTLETVDPAFGTNENVTWTNWTIPIMYNLKIHPTDQSNMPLHHVFVSMYEYAPFDPLAFFGYDTYWGCIPVTNCSGFSRCDIVAEKEGYRDYNVTGLNWTTKSALIKDYKQDIVLARESCKKQ